MAESDERNNADELKAELSQLKGTVTRERLARVRKRNENRQLAALGVLVLAGIYVAYGAMMFGPLVQWIAIIGFIYACRMTYKYVQRKNAEEAAKDENLPLS